MKKENLLTRILIMSYHYLLFFITVAFVVSCSMVLFVGTLSKTLQLKLTEENLNTAAKLTFVNVIFLSILFTIIDALRRKLTTEKITEHIAQAAKKVVQGDFSVRISPVNRFGTDVKFNEIIDCFNTMAEELAGVEMLRTDFIANVSHEMKTPLAVIQNYGTLLQTQGNGLGLALVKRVVDILHSEISVESTIGEGSTFIVKCLKNGGGAK